MIQFAQSSEANHVAVSTQEAEANGKDKAIIIWSERLSWCIQWRCLVLWMIMLIMEILEGVIVKVVSFVKEMDTSGMVMETRKATKLKKDTVVMAREDRKAAGVQKAAVDRVINCKKPSW